MPYVFWPGMLGKKKSKPATANVATGELLAAGFLRLDSFRNRITAKDPPMRLDAETEFLTDADLTAIQCWLDFRGHKVGLDAVGQAARAAARINSYHPIKDYLAACEAACEAKGGAGGDGLLDTLASRVFGCTPGITDEFLRRALIGAVRRIRHPGCRMDTTLVLCGKQGIRKSTFVSELFGPAFTRSQMPDLGSKDASQALQGFWAVELAEMDRIIRAETSTMKEFLTRTFDDYRAAYGRVDERHSRQTIFIGTTNEEDFLTDPSGNRRFWPIVAERVDLDFILTHRDEIWGEAALLESSGKPHWFDDEEETIAEEAREIHVVEDPWHETIADHCKGREWVHAGDCYDQSVANGEIALIARKTKREERRVTNVLRRLGCVKNARFRPEAGRTRKGWLVPNALKMAEPSTAEQERRARYEAIVATKKLMKSN